MGSLPVRPCPGSWGSAWDVTPGHRWAQSQVVVETHDFEWVGDLGSRCALALLGRAAGDCGPAGARVGCMRGSARRGFRQGYAHMLTAAISLVPLKLGTAPGQLSVAQKCVGKLSGEGGHSTPRLRGCSWLPCSPRDAVFMNAE